MNCLTSPGIAGSDLSRHLVQNQNQNSLLVTRQMTLFHQGVRMGVGGGKLVP